MCLINLVELLPAVAVLLKNSLYPPHDCFKCFNKDPDRRYSVFQYTAEEWKAILHSQRPELARLQEAEALAQRLDETDQQNVPTEVYQSYRLGEA